VPPKNARGVKAVKIFDIRGKLFRTSSIVKHLVEDTSYFLWYDSQPAAISDAVMKFFCRSKPSTCDDEHAQQGDPTTVGAPTQQPNGMMNDEEDNESSRDQTSPSPTRTSQCQAKNLRGRDLKRAKSTLSQNEMIEGGSYDVEDTDVWCAEGSVECVLGAF
jgi:hypothetical protein